MKPSTTNANSSKNQIITKITAAAVWILLWQLYSILTDKSLLFPSPILVLQTLFKLAETELFWQSVFISLANVLKAFFSAVILGSFFACISVHFKIIKTFLQIPVSIIRSTPVASFTLLAWIWIESPDLPMFIAFLMVFPIIYENVCKGIESVDNQLLEMAEVYHLSLFKKIRFIYFPAILPFFTSACINGMGFAWKSGISAEVLCLPKKAIGKEIHNAKIYIEIPELFAWTVVVILFSMLLEKLLILLMQKINKNFLLAKGDEK